MTWIQTHSGGAVDLLAPLPEMIHPHDIAVGLARIPRFNGHTIDPFSVAQHSMLVLRIFDFMADRPTPEDRLAALLHDAHEAYMGDLATPVVESLSYFARAAVLDLKQRLQEAVHWRFGLPTVLGDSVLSAIKTADRIALATEKQWLLAPEPKPWDDWEPLPEPWLLADLSLHGRYELARQFEPTMLKLIEEVKS